MLTIIGQILPTLKKKKIPNSVPGWGVSLLSLSLLSLESKHTDYFESLEFGFPVFFKSQFSKSLQHLTTNMVGDH